MAFVPNVRNVRLYQNTGFDIINAPATPSLLDSFTYVDIPAINALQITRLSSVCIKATEDQVTNADYCRISDGTHNAYYAVVDYHMEKPDTCTLSIVMDNMLTAGGITGANWDVLDGITERHHVATANDTLFAYTEDDPLLVPSKPLEVHFEKAIDGKATSAVTGLTVIEATVPLDKLGDTTATPEAVAYETTNGEQCVVPDIPQLSTYSTATMQITPNGSDENTINPAIAYYDGTETKIQKGLARARSLGIETGTVISQVIIPTIYCTSTRDATTKQFTKLGGTTVQGNLIADAKFNYQYGTVHNKRVYAGICNKYGIISIGSGNSAEFNPEDIYHSGDTHPLVYAISDPRPSGKPYFRYQYYKGDTSNFWLNCIAGLNWQNVPLVYTNKSGSEIDTIRFQTDQSIKDENAIVNGVQTFLGNPTGKTPRSFIPGVLSGIHQNGLALGMDFAQTIYGQEGTYTAADLAGISPVYDVARMRANASNQELQEFNISQNIVAPQLMFPRSEGLRDFAGNGCFVYKYYLATSDLAKFDKILTMFGYRITEPLTKDMFNVRSKFNYIKAKGVSIGGSLPKWLREGMAQELAIGKRFWKVAPDKTIYTNGGNT